uniref:Uncharacterized protein n=1 Tax=Odontella aurita TaxID=265563 RepID=A0A6U6DAN8_9STRA|mmetsp:Transcript_19155/g.55714  ORF Transcript_19155/g.55714 Transcript_19155/m.55714 type:complete len:673 (+) Transcript_19155:2565-4583(+)|eukprot:CAMPEP_0113582934 /NCGR_PEP_ID=MMETSP0015_2-20120614/32209_1 /TAXON_ID=2838 /ORGANISM="Odontella" /LENGTH=672 /DNA_ID=CAMNT_0000487699 /DNA_START=224 /DNA_END=2242 /DNA_ORIENTATION=+ /assembly_acc=CAM_ASM_000160
MSSSSDRTAEIWSTRLQRELLALTSDGAGDDKDAVGVIPPFIKVQEHELVIENGVCKVTFRIEVGEDQMAPKKEEGGEAEKEGEESEKGGDADKAEGESGDKADEGADAEAAVAAALSEPAYVALTLDASLARTLDGKVVASPSSYPFQAPGAFLVSGAAYFPEGSEIDDGDRVDIDLDWTPSLHLNDAVLHVALRVRESIRRGEPFSRAASEEEEGKDDIRDKVDESVQVAKERLGNFWGSFKANANKMAAAIDDAVAPRPSPHSSTAGGAAAAAAPEVARASLSTAAAARAPGAFAGNTAKTKRETGPKTSGRTSSVAIGDDLQLAEAPWNVCSGMYTCKAIRRPVFMEDTMEAARRGREQQVAGAGVTGAGSLFKSFTASAKSVLEESLLMITEELIVEMRTNKFTLGTGTVTFVIPISSLAKLKFRRQESVSLFFKQAPDDPVIYMCPDSAECVQQIQTVLKRHGVRGKHTNAATQRSIQAALSIVAEIQRRERQLESTPTVESVNEIMDLYRQAAEKFEQAGDPRHEEVMGHMRKFLAKPLTASILDGSYRKPQTPSKAAKSVPQGEVLEGTQCQLEDGDQGEGVRSPDPVSVSAILKKTDDITEELKRDLANLGDDGDLNNLVGSGLEKNKDGENELDTSGDKDSFAELDAMLSAADKELTDIMNA